MKLGPDRGRSVVAHRRDARGDDLANDRVGRGVEERVQRPKRRRAHGGVSVRALGNDRAAEPGDGRRERRERDASRDGLTVVVSLHQGVRERNDGGEGGFLDVVERVGGGDREHGGDVLQEGREVSRVAGFARRERERLDEREADLLARLEGVHRAAAAAPAAASRGGPGSGSGPDARGDRGGEVLQRRRAVVESLHEREDELRARLAHLLHRIVHAAEDRGEERGDEEGEERGGGRLGGIAEEPEGWARVSETDREGGRRTIGEAGER